MDFNKIILEMISDLNVDKFSAEDIPNIGTFFTIKKDVYSLYLQVLENENILLLSAFRGNDKLPSHEGNINEIIEKIKIITRWNT